MIKKIEQIEQTEQKKTNYKTLHTSGHLDFHL